MTKKYQSFPGMDDILPSEILSWQRVEKQARRFLSAWGFQEIRTPVLEPTELFTRSIGETTDIVHKEMYTFQDRGERQMTLRPEMTASVARAVIQHGLLKTAKSLSLYYLGPMFRAERPQAGRKRQFHQIGAELINQKGPETDLRILRVNYEFLLSLGLSNIRLRLNDLSLMSGSKGEQVRAFLRDFFRKRQNELDEDSKYRLDRNVLRIFDSKVERVRAIAAEVPWENIAPVSPDFSEVLGRLKMLGIPFEIDRRLVRGLDYYTGLVFEIALEGLGAQDAVSGGGRYDHLYQELGGPGAPCTGFSIGIERLLTALLHAGQKGGPGRCFYIAPIAESFHSPEAEKARGIAIRLAGAGLEVAPVEPLSKLADHLKRANQAGADYVLILGPEELHQRGVTLKDMAKREQRFVAEDGIDRACLGLP
ncbi:MAG: histidine--tRNA ligase [Candidatus Omnitrophota bacterium]